MNNNFYKSFAILQARHMVNYGGFYVQNQQFGNVVFVWIAGRDRGIKYELEKKGKKENC